MDRFLPWIAIAGGVLAYVVGWVKASSKGPGPGFDRSLVPAWVGVAALYAIAYGFASSMQGLPDVAHGALIGVVAATLAALGDARVGRSPLVALGLATAVAGGVLLVPEAMRQPLWLGAAIGSGLAAGCAALGASPKGTVNLAAFSIATFAAASVLGAFRDGVDRAAAVPAAIGVVGILALAGVGLGSLNKWARWGIVAAVLLGGAKLISMKYLFYGASFNVALGAVASAAMVAWILDGDDGASPGQFLICAVIWLAWSTIAFGLLQGLGLAISAVFALAFLLGAQSYRGLLSMALLVPLAFYRVFLEAYPAESRQIDVGQQYAVIGIIAGAALPTVLSSWLTSAGARMTPAARPFMALLGGAIVLALLICADFVIGTRGVIGVIVGLAIAPVLAGMVRGEHLGVLAAAGTLTAAVVASFKYVAPHILVERETKIQMLGWCIGIAVILIAAAHWLTRNSSGASLNENTA